MTTPRDRTELRELMARAVCEGGFHAAWPGDDYNDRAQKRAFLKQADALLSALDAAGLVIVPREATEAMVEEHVDECAGDADEAGPERIRDCWRLMCAASPFSVTEDPQP